ncbi:N-terminal nucleophile aminohydrolase [Aaosphaeria arxii CBS 175.79]|uniref:N-terminal nucleophile aminohydrolase n=1 Tax=Aaosphaeria arxii CBS 175.79 TaxID=1450172 RepID=A0A6A5X974_9PLEO|nr:N-terminal nucleophile aminohydrolase [Aaosphaeria arxii CBS 175.79]KAF2009502.1 N-terminal nucleophile aminohydrolase [Aaosphaeria arxii CBS 175.79]
MDTKSHPITPRIIIHGGAGNITRSTITPSQYAAYHSSLLRILSSANALLSKPGATALDVATHAVSLLEDDPLYNSGKGAVFTRAGTNELECSIMVSNGYRKRGVGCMMLSHVKNPIKLAREVLVRGEEADGGGAKDHCQYAGEFIERRAREWGLEMVDPAYYFTQKKWDEHKRGLEEEEKKTSKSKTMEVDELSDWERQNYIPLGTCGAVVLDSFGTVCTATSTGGLTNKVPGRIGDTPTLGAGYWAEEWYEDAASSAHKMLYQQPSTTSPLDNLSRGNITTLLADCLPITTSSPSHPHPIPQKAHPVRHALALSSSGNGDTFLRLSSSRTVAAKSRFASLPLSTTLPWMAGPNGELQRSAGDRWGKVHEGVGGMIGIEIVGSRGEVVCDYNCGGMFRAWTDEEGGERCLIFREDGWGSGPE